MKSGLSLVVTLFLLGSMPGTGIEKSSAAESEQAVEAAEEVRGAAAGPVEQSNKIEFTELGISLYGKFRFESEGELFDLIDRSDGTDRIVVPAGAVLTCIRRSYSIGYFAGGATLSHEGKTTRYAKIFFCLKPSGELSFHEPSEDGNFPGKLLAGTIVFDALFKVPQPDAK